MWLFRKNSWITAERLPTSLFAFALLTLVSLMQLPASALIRHYDFSIGVLVNEWILLFALIYTLLCGFKIDLKKLFPQQALTKKAWGHTVALSLALCIVIDYATFFSEQFFPLPAEFKDFLKRILSIHSWQEGVWKWFLLCMTPAFCEEFFFRGVLQGSLTRQLPRMWAVSVTALFFAILHGNPWYFHLYLLLGFYLCWLLQISQNIWIPILAHFMNNSWTYFTAITDQKIPHDEHFQQMDGFIFAVSLLAVYWFGRKFVAACKM